MDHHQTTNPPGRLPALPGQQTSGQAGQTDSTHSTYATDERIDAFCRDLALALRRITGRESQDTLDLPTPVAG